LLKALAAVPKPKVIDETEHNNTDNAPN
jgi:type VI secretion system protein ImpB